MQRSVSLIARVESGMPGGVRSGAVGLSLVSVFALPNMAVRSRKIEM